MAIRTLAEIRTNILSVTRESGISSLVDSFINLTIDEIQNPAWAFDLSGTGRGFSHNWTFNRRKASFVTVASTETYQLPRDVDKISLIRQTTSPVKLKYYPDNIFYRRIPYPTATGNPICYRLWEEEGISTRLAVADTVTVVSSSTSDTSAITVSVVGYDANNIIQSESLSLNGTTPVVGTLTYAANKPLRISKSAQTVGNITVTETSGATTLVILGKEDRSPRFKVIGLYPIPSGVVTMYLEYYTRIRNLVNDADVADIDEKWIWVLRAGALSKVYQYQNKTEDFILAHQNIYAAGVRAMVKDDMQQPDYMPSLMSQNHLSNAGIIELGDDNFVGVF